MTFQPEWRGDLLVIPSTPTPPVVAQRRPEILSRADIARRRNQSPRNWVEERHDQVAAAMGDTSVEMHEADVTPLPKNKGGRPRKNP